MWPGARYPCGSACARCDFAGPAAVPERLAVGHALCHQPSRRRRVLQRRQGVDHGRGVHAGNDGRGHLTTDVCPVALTSGPSTPPPVWSPTPARRSSVGSRPWSTTSTPAEASRGEGHRAQVDRQTGAAASTALPALTPRRQRVHRPRVQRRRDERQCPVAGAKPWPLGPATEPGPHVPAVRRGPVSVPRRPTST